MSNFYTYAAAAYAANREVLKHKVVKTRHWSCDLWDWVPCWTIVLVVPTVRNPR